MVCWEQLPLLLRNYYFEGLAPVLRSIGMNLSFPTQGDEILEVERSLHPRLESQYSPGTVVH